MERRRLKLINCILAIRSVSDGINRFAQNYHNVCTNDLVHVNSITFRREFVPKVDEYVEYTVQRYEPNDFKNHFRLERSTFELLIEQLGYCPELKPRQIPGNPQTDITKSVLVFLWYAGNLESFRSMADRFGLSKSTAHSCCKKVASAIQNRLMQNIIKWPYTENQKQEVAEGFSHLSSLPDVIGVVDGCHIRIKAPTDHPQAYFNRKHFYSVVLQGVCDHQLMFTNVMCGWPGSTHDARVMRNSSVFQNAHKFTGEEYIIADTAYPLKTFLQTPFKDFGHLTPDQKRFNRELCAARQVIERAFGHLKGRFRRLTQFDVSDIQFLVSTVLAACTLHNICIAQKDEMLLNDIFAVSEDDVHDRGHRVPRDDRAGQLKRLQLVRQINNQ